MTKKKGHSHQNKQHLLKLGHLFKNRKLISICSQPKEQKCASKGRKHVEEHWFTGNRSFIISTGSRTDKAHSWYDAFITPLVKASGNLISSTSSSQTTLLSHRSKQNIPGLFFFFSMSNRAKIQEKINEKRCRAEEEEEGGGKCIYPGLGGELSL